MTQDIHKTPWGSWEVLHESDKNVIKILTVNPGGMLSLQRHMLRAETWIPMESGLIAILGEMSFGSLVNYQGTTLHRYDNFSVPLGVWHRLVNPTVRSIDVIEVIIGDYKEDDIERIHDLYGRELNAR